MKRRFFLVGTGLSSLLAGCSPYLSQSRKVPHYTEAVSSILVSSDSASIVVIGKENTYVFDSPRELVNVFKAPYYSKVSAVFSDFFVSASTVSGAFTLFLVGDATEEEERALKVEGWHREIPLEDRGKPPEQRPRYFLQRRINLNGLRYGPTNITGADARQKSNRSYRVRIQELDKHVVSSSVGLSPVEVGKTGLFILGFFALAPIALMTGNFPGPNAR